MKSYHSLLRTVSAVFWVGMLSLVKTDAQPALSIGPTTEFLELNPSIQFIFSEPMDSDGIDVTWTGNVDASKFQCDWIQSFPGLPVIILQCHYQGGLPEGVEVTYTLNAGNSGVMKSASGQPLAEVSGTFVTPGDGGGDGGGVFPPIEQDCDSDPVNTQEEGSLYLFRNLEFLQEGSVLSSHPERPHGVMGGLTVPQVLSNAELGSLTLMKPNGSSEPLVHFDNPLGADWFVLSSDPFPNMVPPAFANVASLTEAFPSGLYQYVGQSDLGSVTVPLQMSGLDAVSDPVFAQLTSIPHDALDQAWSLHWEAMAGAAGNSSLSLSIEDLNGNRVFHAPNECEQIELSPTATSISLPAGLLMAGQSYKVSLNFFTLTDQGQNQSLGISHYAGIGKRTEMLIGPGNGNTQPVSLEFSHITQDQGGIVTLTVSGTLNVSTPSVMIEQTTDWRNWTPFKEVTLDMLSQGGGSAQLTDASAPLFPAKFYRIP